MFNEATQDHIFGEYLIDLKAPSREAIMDYLDGETDDLSAAMRGWAYEFASASVEIGKTIQNGTTVTKDKTSYYDGDGANSAHIDLSAMRDALEETLESRKNWSKTAFSTN